MSHDHRVVSAAANGRDGALTALLDWMAGQGMQPYHRPQVRDFLNSQRTWLPELVVHLHDDRGVACYAFHTEEAARRHIEHLVGFDEAGTVLVERPARFLWVHVHKQVDELLFGEGAS